MTKDARPAVAGTDMVAHESVLVASPAKAKPANPAVTGRTLKEKHAAVARAVMRCSGRYRYNTSFGKGLCRLSTQFQAVAMI